MKYRIYYSHSPSHEDIFCNTEIEAFNEFNRRCKDPHNSMDKIWMDCIEIEEKLSPIIYMKANEARKLTCDNKLMLSKNVIAKVYSEIEKSAKKGNDSTTFDLEGQNLFTNEIIKMLKDDGYKVTHENGSDQRDGDSWNYLTISW